MAAGAALFLPPSMSAGFKEAISKGPPYLVTFFVVFTFTQSIGGLVGSAFYGTLITIREKFHSAVLTERVLLTDPHVATRVSQLSSSYGKVIGDSALLKGEGWRCSARRSAAKPICLPMEMRFCRRRNRLPFSCRPNYPCSLPFRQGSHGRRSGRGRDIQLMRI